MKTILLLIINMSLMGQGNYTLWQRHKDSLKIYQVYKEQIAFMDQCSRNNDYAAWIKRSDSDDSSTVCEKFRLKKWNKVEYRWMLRKEMEGFGESYLYGVPDSMVAVIERNGFSIIEIQTRFLTRPDGKTKIPFIERWWFDADCTLLKKDRLNPVTYLSLTNAEALAEVNGGGCFVSIIK